MHGSSYRLLTQLCLVAFWERSLCPEGAHLIKVNHGDNLLTGQCQSNSFRTQKGVSPSSLKTKQCLNGRDRQPQRQFSTFRRKDLLLRSNGWKETIGLEINNRRNSCLDFVKLEEVDSRLSVKCTCHQTSAKVKYSSFYVHNYICSRCTSTAGYEMSVAPLW